MDRSAFLNAQLWLRPLTVQDALMSAIIDPASCSIPPAHEHVKQLLPPLREGALASTDGPAPAVTPLMTAWCCFHVGERFCVFRSTNDAEDQTQMEVEFWLVNETSSAAKLYVRFGMRHAFQVDLPLIEQVHVPSKAPERLRSDSGMSKSQASPSSTQEPPPFACLDMGSVSMRVWLDSTGNGAWSRANAIAILRKAFAPIQRECRHLRATAESADRSSTSTLATWKRIFRHSRHSEVKWEERSLSVSQLLEWTDSLPAAQVDRVRGVIVQRFQHASQGEAQAEADGNDRRLTMTEIVQLAREMLSVIGEDKLFVERLLGWGRSRPCNVHDNCLMVSRNHESAGCVTGKWHEWEGFLDACDQVVASTASDGRFTGDAEQQIQRAVDAFDQAILSATERRQGLDDIDEIRKQLSFYEHVHYEALFTSSATDELSQSSQQQSANSLIITTPKRHRSQRKRPKVDQVMELARSKRRQLLRDELSLLLLPTRHEWHHPDTATAPRS